MIKCEYVLLVIIMIIIIHALMIILDRFYEPSKTANISKKPFSKSEYRDANEIIDNLWVGNVRSALDKEFIENNNIKLIVNLSKDIGFIDIDGITKVRVPIHDNLSRESDEGMIENFDNAYNIIDKTLGEGDGVLIHCWAGMQRSASLCALYLMKKNRKSFAEVKGQIRNKRSICFTPGVNFSRSIRYLENEFKKV